MQSLCLVADDHAFAAYFRMTSMMQEYPFSILEPKNKIHFPAFSTSYVTLKDSEVFCFRVVWPIELYQLPETSIFENLSLKEPIDS